MAVQNDKYGDTVLNKQRRIRVVAEALKGRGPCNHEIVWSGGGIVLCNSCFQKLLRSFRNDVGMVDELVPGICRVKDRTCLYG